MDINFRKQVGISFFGTAAYSFFAMILPFITVKLFDAHIYGEYAYYLSIIQLLSVLSILGLDNGLIYFSPKVGDRYNLAVLFIINLVSVIFAIIAMLLGYLDIKYIPMYILYVNNTFFFSISRIYNKIKEFYIINVFFNQCITLIFLAIFFYISVKQGVVISYTVGFLISVFIFFALFKSKFKIMSIDKKIILYSLPLLFTSVMSVLMDKIDIIMLKNYVSMNDIGIYSVAVKIATITSIFLTIFNIVFAPQISRYYHSHDIDKLKKMYLISARSLMAFSSFAIIVILILTKYILSFFGVGFLIATNVVIFRSVGQLINSAVGSVWYMISMTGRVKWNLIGTGIAAFINIILNWILIPILSIDGAAIASMISVGFLNIMGYILVKKYFDVKLFWVF